MRAPSTYQGIAAFAVAAALVLVCMSSAKHFSPLGGLAVIVPILPGNISPLALFSRMGSAPILGKDWRHPYGNHTGKSSGRKWA
jgi:hypothetical protein